MTPDAWAGADVVRDLSECPACGRESCEGGCESNQGGEPSAPSSPTDTPIPKDFSRHPRTGAIVNSSLGNIRLALRKLGTTLTYDAFSRVVLINDLPADDAGIDALWIAIDDSFGFRPSKDVLYTLTHVDARSTPLHRVRGYLDGLQWDRTPRLDTWLITYAGAPDTLYTRAVGALPLLAAVRRVRHPGAKFDELLVLESPQGTLKSSALRALCPDDTWFSDDLPLGVDSKLVVERTVGKWIIEAAEMHGNRGREVEALKAFLSRQVDGPVRLAYGRLPVTVPRQFVLIGTTNARIAYLKDGTGGRRFWPVTVDRFDLAALERNRDQLWAEAAAREATGAPIRLPPALWAAAGEQQETRRAFDPWEPILDPLLGGDGLSGVKYIAVEAIWSALKLEACHRDNRHADRVAGILQRHGFIQKKKVRIDGTPTWCWWRPDDDLKES